MKTRIAVTAVFAVQATCTVFFVSEIVSSVFGLRSVPISWRAHELLEIGAALGLILGFIMGVIIWLRARRETRLIQAKLNRAQSAFQDLAEARFVTWGLTPAERDVALFALKGMTTAEIADLRQTSEGTVKAQSNAIYRKAGVSSRTQLLGLFIEDLTSDWSDGAPAALGDG